MAVFLAAFVVGSFYDYQLSDALFQDHNTFGLIISVIGTVPGYGVAAFIAGGFFSIFLLKKDYKTLYRVLLCVAAVGTFGVSIYFTGREFFGPNGFNWIGVSSFWGFFIAFPIDAGIAYLGYRMTSKSKNDNLWLLYIIIAVTMSIVLLGGTSLFKIIFHRPRFRSIIQFEAEGLSFYEWWTPCKDYKGLMESFNLTSEEFKSFPSGHASSSAIFMMVVPFITCIDTKYKKLVLPLFYCGFVWTLLVSFTRILVGAHFLSDVGFGALLSVIFFVIARIVITQNKTLSDRLILKEEEQAQ